MPGRPSASVRILGSFGLGVAGVLLGLSPWLISGPRLPLQNLWTQQTSPEAMPLALLPISQYYASTIAALLIVGGTASGLATRLLVPRGFRAVPVALGLSLAHAAAIGQSFAVLYEGLDPGGAGDSRAWLYLAGMLGGTLLAAAAAQGAFWLTSRPSTGLAALGLVLSAVPLASWVGVWFATLGGAGGPDPFAGQVVRWLPALVVAAALVWCGVAPPRRLAIWLTGLLVLCAAPPLITAATTALGTRALRGDPAETINVLLAVLRAAVWTGVPPAALALGLATVTTFLVTLRRRRASGASHRGLA